MEEQKPEKYTREYFAEQGRLGVKKQLKGLTKKQIKERMKKVREGQKIKK